MSDIFFKATSQRAFESMRETLDFGGATDTLAPGSIVQTKAVLGRDGNVVTPAVTDPNWHFNVRLGPSGPDGEQLKKNFARLAGATRKSVDSTRRTGVTHSWDHVTNPDGEVWLVDPPPSTPARIWLGDAAPAVGRG